MWQHIEPSVTNSPCGIFLLSTIQFQAAWAARIHRRTHKSSRCFLNGLFCRSLWTLPVVFVSAVIDGGSHPFPFRTRKLSLLSPMVLGLRARKSRSLQDSRSPLPNGEGLLFFIPASPASGHADPWFPRAGSGQHQLLLPAFRHPRGGESLFYIGYLSLADSNSALVFSQAS